MEKRNLQLVERFYQELWNKHNLSECRSILGHDFKFKGSLGLQEMNIEAFKNYVDQIHTVLQGYTCEIVETVCRQNKIFAKMVFSGNHTGIFRGYKPSGRRISWHGAALFTIEDEKIQHLWVLGDLENLDQQLKENSHYEY